MGRYKLSKTLMKAGAPASLVPIAEAIAATTDLDSKQALIICMLAYSLIRGIKNFIKNR